MDKVKLAKREIEVGWELIDEDVPIGKEYIVLSHPTLMWLENDQLERKLQLYCILVSDGISIGYIPIDLFEWEVM